MNDSSLTSLPGLALPPVSVAADATGDDRGEDDKRDKREDSKHHQRSSVGPVLRFVSTVNMVFNIVMMVHGHAVHVFMCEC